MDTAETLLRAFPLDTPAGRALMSLAEALPRVTEPDAAERLIHDLLKPIDWHQHQDAESRLVTMASRGLALARQLGGDVRAASGPWWSSLGRPMVRRVLGRGIRRMASQFVLGETLDSALKRARPQWQQGITHSFDMLGEAAITADDASRYYSHYSEAIDRLATAPGTAEGLRPSISIKLSALHPRCQPHQWPRLQQELLPRLLALVEQAARRHVAVTLDAEEADRFELTLMLFERTLASLPAPARPFLGLALQAYGKRAWPTLPWLRELAHQHNTKLTIRLVKGAYWDTEIKRAQQRGLADYPVFTSKRHTDIAYLACARWLLDNSDAFYPQFATHNAVTLAHLLRWRSQAPFELQRLHGMGEPLFRAVRAQYPDVPVRIYAPVGNYQELLPYLVRRLLENGANSSFVNGLHNPDISAETLASHPLDEAQEQPAPPPPRAIFEPIRPASPGLFLACESERQRLFHELNAFVGDMHHAPSGAIDTIEARSPGDGSLVGSWVPLSTDDLAARIRTAQAAQPQWSARHVAARAASLDHLAQLLEQHRSELVALIGRETGRTIESGLEEVREAADLCRYYGRMAVTLMGVPLPMPGPAGEQNQLLWRPRGLFACISPWNFPVAIFTGQIAAAVVTGNAVIAKPAEQATLTATAVHRLILQAGIPPEVVQLAPGPGETVGAALTASESIAGVAFTGGWPTAQLINRTLANRSGAIVPLVAETGGINALIADATVLPQQLVQDVVRSAFDSAGQRCSALRLLCVPDSIAHEIEQLLIGAMNELKLGNPLDWSTDIGPVIDEASQRQLLDYIDAHRQRGTLVHHLATPDRGCFVPPTLIRLNDPAQLHGETFGPILHLIAYRGLEPILEWLRGCGYGLTCGLHSRNETWAREIADSIPIGNIYINRDIIGAVVTSQPFGGTGRSGTGFKAGGPHYLLRFLTEQTVTINTAAVGGDTALLTGGGFASHDATRHLFR